MILADLGADVIKVEPATGGDMIRKWGPHDRGVSVYYLSANRNKRCLALDFRHAEAEQVLREFAMKSDVLVENFRPGTMHTMGLSYDSLAALHPGLIYASVTGFGGDGPAGQLPGFDQIAQGYSGLMSVTGSPSSGPTRVGVAIADQAAGMWAALGILSAVIQKTQTQKGQKVETSLLASLVGLLSVQGQRYLNLGEVPGLTGNSHPVISPYGLFQTADGPLNIAPATSEMWRKLCILLDAPQLLTDTRFTENADRVKHRSELTALLEERLCKRSRTEWTTEFVKAGIPAGPINTIADVFADPQVQHCNMVQQVEHPQLGLLKLVASPIGLSESTAGSVRTPPPILGEHTEEILRDYGVSPEKIAALIKGGVVMSHAALTSTEPDVTP